MSKRLGSALLIAALFCVGGAARADDPAAPARLTDDPSACELNTRKPRQPCEPLDATSPALFESIARWCGGITLGLGGIPVIGNELHLFCRRVSADAATSPAAPAKKAHTANREPAPPEGVDPCQYRLAQRMYLIGESCRKKGDLDMAKNCYEQTERMCPQSDYARKAMLRLRKVQAMRARTDEGAGEAAEPAKETPKEDDEYQIQLEFPGPSRLGHSGESDEALRERMKQEAARFGERLGSTEEESPSVCPCPHAELFHETAEDLEKLTWVKGLYRIGERCRKNGDPEMACRWYEEACGMCPNSRYGRKAKARLKQLQREGADTSNESPQSESSRTPWTDPRYFSLSEAIDLVMRDTKDSPPAASTALLPALPPVDGQIVPAFNRLLIDAAEPRKPDLVLIEARSSGPVGGAIVQAKTPSLFVEMPSRHLVLGEEQFEPKQDAAPSDLSDWLRETVRTLKGAGSVRVEVSRLGRLLAQGEAALRELGCEIIQDEGRSYVVYPARRR